MRTCIQKQVSSLLELLQTGIDRHFLAFHIAGRYNLQISSKPLGLIEKWHSIGKHDIHPNERVFLSKEVEEGCDATPTDYVFKDDGCLSLFNLTLKRR
ncbi:hypothetical protein [Peribacillus frigoritolerans]